MKQASWVNNDDTSVCGGITERKSTELEINSNLTELRKSQNVHSFLQSKFANMSILISRSFLKNQVSIFCNTSGQP